MTFSAISSLTAAHDRHSHACRLDGAAALPGQDQRWTSPGAWEALTEQKRYIISQVGGIPEQHPTLVQEGLVLLCGEFQDRGRAGNMGAEAGMTAVIIRILNGQDIGTILPVTGDITGQPAITSHQPQGLAFGPGASAFRLLGPAFTRKKNPARLATFGGEGGGLDTASARPIFSPWQNRRQPKERSLDALEEVSFSRNSRKGDWGLSRPEAILRNLAR